MTKATLRFTADPGHGWLHVKRDIARMIMGDDFNKISSFSYQRGATLYLEEDCDAGYFLKACKERGVEVDTKVTHYRSLAPIRSYQSFHP